MNFAFDSYLTSGSIKPTMQALNSRGYRTKSYTSRRERHHPGSAFTTSSTQYLLKNPAYIAKKEINKSAKVRGKREYRMVDAIWPAIVDAEKFEAAQRLMKANGQSNHNGSTPIRHTYVLSQGLLHCGRCSTSMEGRSGNGRGGVKYFYYVFLRDECSLRVAASEVEGAVLARLRELAGEDGLLDAIVAQTNGRLAKELPSLEARRSSLDKKLAAVRSMADKVVAEWSAMDAEAGRDFLSDKLSQLSSQRSEIEEAIAEVDVALTGVRGLVVEAETVRCALADMHAVYEQLKPFERKELMRLVLNRVEVNERQIVLEIHGGVCAGLAQPPIRRSATRSVAPSWLPGQDSNLQPIG